MFRMPLCALAALCANACPAADTFHFLNDRNAQAILNDAGGAGMSGWSVDSTVHLAFQGLYARIGDIPFELPLDTESFTLNSSTVLDTNPLVDPRPDALSVQYEGFGFTLDSTWTLRGTAAGSGRSSVAQSITITNTNTEPMELALFQYSDFDVGAHFMDDVVELSGTPVNTARQHDPVYGGMVESVATTAPSRYEAGQFPSLIQSLTDFELTNLSNNPGPLSAGHVVWAFQWDMTIAPAQSVLLGTHTQIVIPAAPTLGVGVAAMALVGRRRRGT